MVDFLKYLKETMAIKSKYTLLFIAVSLLLASTGVSICGAEEVARYAASQEKKQIYLEEVREDVSVLTSCLQPQVSHTIVKGKSDITAGDVSKADQSLSRTGSHN